MKRLELILMSTFLIITLITLSHAEVPKLINYQGHLTDKGGNPLTGNVDIVFRIYSTESGGTALWTEIQNNVTVKNGIFNVLLGSATVGGIPESIFDSPDRWLGVAVEGDSEMSPRQRLVSVPYAYKAGQADTIPSGNLMNVQQANGTTDVSVSSTSFVDMPDMSLNVNVGNGEIVIIDFSCVTEYGGGNGGEARFLLLRDNTVLQKASAHSPNYNFHEQTNMQYIDTPSAGTYTYKVQWKSGGGGPQVCEATSEYHHRNLRIVKIK